MKWTILLLLLITGSLLAATLPPGQKALLDIYYSSSKDNSIPGSRITEGTLSSDKFSTNVQESIQAGSNAYDWVVANTDRIDQVEQDAQFGTNWIGTYSNQLWYLQTNAIAFSTSLASPHTISVSETNMYICVVSNYAGYGTNWLRIPLQHF